MAHNSLKVMENKFESKFDYLQAVVGILASGILISINQNVGTIILGSIILMFGIYKAFGRRIYFYEKDIIIRYFNRRTKINYSEVKEVSYTTHLYGKPILSIRTNHMKFKGYIDFSEWEKLKDWLEIKGIKCIEVR